MHSRVTHLPSTPTTTASLFLPPTVSAPTNTLRCSTQRFASPITHVTATTRSSTNPSAIHNKITSARAIRDMDKATEAAALADIQDDEELEQKLKAMQVKAEARCHRDHAGDGDEEEVKEPGGHAGDDELALPEERWNPHWQSNLKLLQVNRFILGHL